MIRDVIRDLGYLALGTRLRRLGERLQAETQSILDDHELAIQSAQFPFLAAIDRLGPSTVGDLAAAVGVSQPAATRAIGLLVDAALVATAIDRDDQRCRRVELAPRGRALVEAGKRRVWPVIAAAVRDLCDVRADGLLEQLAAIEDGLAETSLSRRARREAATAGAPKVRAGAPKVTGVPKASTAGAKRAATGGPARAMPIRAARAMPIRAARAMPARAARAPSAPNAARAAAVPTRAARGAAGGARAKSRQGGQPR